jgi:predicted peptidase
MKCVMVLAALAACHAQTVELKTASTSPMQYYLSLPRGWTADREWPLVIVIESANRQFEQTANLFVQARGAMPFILAAPLVVTNGGRGGAQGCQTDQEGITAVVADLRKQYRAEDRYYLTGWEAGGHTVWSTVFQHPEALRAAALAGPNYAARCAEFSSHPARASLPVKVFLSGIAADAAPNLYVHQQSSRAKNEGEQHGFRAITVEEISGKPHGPMPEEILAWFQSLR